MDLQSYSHYSFSKISRSLFDFLNNTYSVSLFQKNNSLIFRTGVSCFSVTLFYFTLFCCGGKAKLVRFTLFYSTLLTLTDRRNDRQRNKYTCFAWAGGTFFVSVFWLWREIVLKMRTRFYKKILLGYFIMIQQPMCVFIRPNTLLLCIFLCCIFLSYRTDSHIEVQIRILPKDKYRKSCQNCEHWQSHFDFLKMPISFLFFEKQIASKTVSTFNMYQFNYN